MPKSPEQCAALREQTRQKILHKSILYFARNGFSGTKISDLASHIGVAQGTIYLYFPSKEDLFHEIRSVAAQGADFKKLKALCALPVTAKKKISMLSSWLLLELTRDETFAAMVALNTQMLLEASGESSAKDTTYQSGLYQDTMKLIKQGQRENSVVDGSPAKLADYYWGVVYLYSLKRLFTSSFEMIDTQDLNRTLLKTTGEGQSHG